MTNVNVVAEEIYAQAGSNLKGWREGFINSAAKAGATDTWTVTNASEVLWACLTNDGTGALDPVTSISANVITGSVGTGATSGKIIFRR